MTEPGLWLTEDDVSSLMTLEDAIDVLADAYRLQARGQASSMRRAHAREADAIVHAVGGIVTGAGVTGIKAWTYTPRGASPLVIMFSLDDGSVRGVIQAFALGQMRTAATSGLGTRVLAREDADTLALLGTGKQAFSQAQAVASVRSLREIRVFGRDPSRREAMAHRLQDELDVNVVPHDDVAAALDGAAIATSITRSAEPFLLGDWLSPGTHLNAVGSIVPSRRELDASAVARCDVIVVDSVEQARDDAGELRAAVAEGRIDWDRVRGLDSVVDRTPAELRQPADVTLFKALGVGLSDVALGAELLRRAAATGAGRPLPQSALAGH